MSDSGKTAVTGPTPGLEDESMMSAPTDNQQKVIVFQTWGIGDMIMSTPMLSALRQRLPDARITVVAGSKASSEVVLDSAICDEVRVISFKEISLHRLFQWFYRLRGERFDAAFICTGISVRVAQLLRLFANIEIIAGDSTGKNPGAIPTGVRWTETATGWFPKMKSWRWSMAETQAGMA